MQEVICPNCKKSFNLDDAGYSEILKQVRNEEFARDLDERLKQAEADKKTAIQLAEANKDTQLAQLKAQLDQSQLAQQLAVTNALAEAKETFASELAMKDAEIAVHKDFKARLSTKMLGETLEQHCQIEFEKVRSMAFPNAYFEKDNDAKSGSKGDYIFKDSSDDGIELLSIMFEMKNEADETATKKKNEDFFKELDKDRNQKGCEYAVLVSNLEKDSELYNTGIVDVSHKYPKMYVIRPQFFLPLISILRNSSINALEYKAELVRVQQQNLDITNFENKLGSYKESIEKNYRLASDKFGSAIETIDKAIEQLEKTKKALQGSEENLRLANSKAEEITIKSLTRGNATMAQIFKDQETGSTESIQD